MSARDGGRFLASRALTLGVYTLAIIGVTGWDRDPNSWPLIAFHLFTGAWLLWWAVNRTIRHYHEDERSGH